MNLSPKIPACGHLTQPWGRLGWWCPESWVRLGTGGSTCTQSDCRHTDQTQTRIRVQGQATETQITEMQATRTDKV